MTKVHRFGIVVILAVAMALAPALAGNVTVSRFYTEIAEAKRLVSSDGASAEASLRGAGVNLPKLALDKSLTEGDMAAISTALGLTVTTERPSQLISESQLNTYLSSFGSQLGVKPAGFELNGLPNQSGNGKGKKKGHHKSGIEPL